MEKSLTKKKKKVVNGEEKKIRVTKIVIKIRDKEVSLSLDEIKDLKEALEEILGKTTITAIGPWYIPYYVPYTPMPRPWNDTWIYTTSIDSSVNADGNVFDGSITFVLNNSNTSSSDNTSISYCS